MEGIEAGGLREGAFVDDHSRSSHRISRTPENARLRLAVGALVLLAFFSPLALGSARLWGALPSALLALCALALTAAGMRQAGEKLVVSIFGWTSILLTAWTGFQIVPLPLPILRLISPAAAGLWEFSVSAAPGAILRFAPISLDPPATAAAFVRLAACSAALIACLNLCRGRRRSKHLLRAVSLSGFAVAVAGYAHTILGLHTFFGAETLSSRQNFFFSSLINQNHLASFLAMTGLLGVGCALDTRETGKRLTLLVTTILTAAGAVLTLSRGGIIALGAGFLVMLAVVIFQRVISRTRFVRAGIVILFAFMAVVALSGLLAYGLVTKELGSIECAGSVFECDKFMILKDVPKLIRDYPLTGVGADAFGPSYEHYFTISRSVFYTHAENVAVQSLADWGAPVAILLACVVIFGLLRLIANRSSRYRWAAGIAALFAILLQNFVDFSLWIPSVSIAACCVFGALAGVHIYRHRPAKRGPPAAAIVFFGAVLGAALISIAAVYGYTRSLDADAARLSATLRSASPAAVDGVSASVIGRHPADYFHHLMLGSHFLKAGEHNRCLAHLNRAMYLNTAAFEPHLFAARLFTETGRRDQALVEYKLALEKTLDPAPILAEMQHTLSPSVEELNRSCSGKKSLRLALADHLRGLGMLPEARAVLESATAEYGHDWFVDAAGARLLQAEGKLDEAERIAKGLISDIPSQPEGYLLYAGILSRQKRFDEVKDLYQRAVAMLPLDLTLRFSFASHLISIGQPAAAESVLLGVVMPRDATPSQRSAYHSLMANVHEAEGKPFVALVEVKRECEIFENVSCLMRKAALFEKLGMLAEASSAYRDVAERFPAQQRSATENADRIEAKEKARTQEEKRRQYLDEGIIP